ncbi:MAG: lysylphosphatidylglycerol synthase transmembrane domain-containing protein [Chloroflexota bacterium]
MAIRIIITVAGLAYAAYSIDFNEMWAVLSGANWWWVFAGFMLINTSMVLRAYRWLVLLKGLGVSRLKMGRLIELYFVGNFFNAFLPSGFGGDVVRVVEVAQEVPADVASGTVFLDRFTGLLVLFVMGLIGLPFRPAEFPSLWTWIILVVCLVGLLGGVILLDGRLIRWLGNSPFGRLIPKALSPVGDGPIAKFLAAVQGCGWLAIWQALGVSALFDVMLVGWWTMATLALGAAVPYLYNLLVVPIFAIALMVPSVGGLGVRESVAPSLYAGAGLEPATAVSVSIVVFIMLRLSGLLGGPVYLWRALKGERVKAKG